MTLCRDTPRRKFQHAPVEITRHGRREFVLMSVEHYDWLRAAAQRTHRTADVVQVVIDAVERAEMDREHDALDDLLKPAPGPAEGECSKVS